MFRALSASILGIALIALACGPTLVAQEKKKEVGKEAAKEVKLVGKITCPKCDLGTADKCGTVIVVEKKIYVFDEASNKKFHDDICKEGKEGTVTAKVTDAGKMIISVSKLEFKK